jgi:hypothetical protein
MWKAWVAVQHEPSERMPAQRISHFLVAAVGVSDEVK